MSMMLLVPGSRDGLRVVGAEAQGAQQTRHRHDGPNYLLLASVAPGAHLAIRRGDNGARAHPLDVAIELHDHSGTSIA
jgi:hypothetical protein